MAVTYPMAVVTEPGKVEFREKSLPELSEKEVLIRTRAASICGSDLHLFKGKHPSASLPAAVGHEISGEVMKVGHAVVRLSEGDRVTVEPVLVCGECSFCKRGDYNLCTDISFHYRRGQGGFAPYFVAEEGWVHVLPEKVSFEGGALMEPLSVAVHAVQKARPQLGQHVAVFGAGAIGLLILLLIRHTGAGDVFSVDVNGFRLQKAKELGASEVFDNNTESVVESIIDGSGGLGVDVSFEAVGRESTLVQSLQVLKKGGTAILLGLFTEPDVTIPPNIFIHKEISLVGSQGYCRDFQTALGLVGRGDICLEPLITHRFPLASLQEAFDILSDPSQDTVKVVITFD